MTWWCDDNNPYHNLALETSLFKQKVGPDVLLWQNRPSLIIGRNQSPWHEIQLQRAYSENVPVIRRFSGGGTVYHDLGNLNISFLDGSSKSAHFESIMKTFSLLGIPAVVGERGEITVQGYKISGTAYYYSQGRFLHHLTMLFDTDIDKLWQMILHKPMDVSTKAVASVRQPVANLSVLYPNYTMYDFVDAFDSIRGVKTIRQSFERCVKSVPNQSFAVLESVVEDMKKLLMSWQWTYGNTPDFSSEIVFMGVELKLTVKSGRVFAVEALDKKEDKDVLLVENQFFKERMHNPYTIEDWHHSKTI